MRGICISITKEDEDTINDLVQDAFILTYNSLGKLKDNSKFKEWCATITKNIALRHLEKKSKVEVVPLSSFMDEELEVEGALSTDSILYEKDIFRTYQHFALTSSLTKYVFYNWLINNILYLCVT